jgi:hypothetical protein
MKEFTRPVKLATTGHCQTVSLAACLVVLILAPGCGTKPNGRQEKPTSATTKSADKSTAEREPLRPLINQTSKPLTVEEARQKLTFLLPDSAKNVQFASYREWVAALDFIRFEAPVEDCCAIAQKIIAQHNTENPDRRVQGLRPLDRTDRNKDQPMLQSTTSPLSVPWFDPQSIRKGFVAGETHSHTPSIWIDAERGVFYYQYTD